MPIPPLIPENTLSFKPLLSTSYSGEPVDFIGMARGGEVIVQFENGCISMKQPSELRMRKRSIDPKEPHVRELLDVIAQEFGLRRPGASRTFYLNIYPKQPGARGAACFLYEDEINARATAGATATIVALEVEIEE